MSIIKRRLAVVLDKEIIAAAVLIALFGGWLLVNFASGFNLPLYLAAGFAGAALTVVFPRSGIYAMVFLLLVFANFFSLQPLMIGNVEYKFYLIDIILTAIIFGIGLRILSGRIKIYLRLGDWLMIGWLALTAVYFIYSVRLWNGDAVLAFSSFKNYGFYSLLYFIAYLLLDTRAAWRRLAGFVGAGAAVIIGFIAYGLITGQGLWTEITPLSTAGSRILDFNHAFYLSLVIIGGLSYLAFNRDWKGRLIYWLLPIFLIGVIGSLMRHLWLALAAALLFVFLAITKEGKKRLWQAIIFYAVIGAMLAAMGAAFIATEPFAGVSREAVAKIGELQIRAASLLNTDDTSIAWRNAVWQSVWQEYRQHPWRGLGFGQKVFIDMGDYQDYVEVRNIHNSWLAICVQMGLAGSLLLAWWLGLMIKKVWRATAKDGFRLSVKHGLAGMIAFCAIAFLFQPYLEANFFNVAFWLIMGLSRRFYENSLS